MTVGSPAGGTVREGSETWRMGLAWLKQVTGGLFWKAVFGPASHVTPCFLESHSRTGCGLSVTPDAVTGLCTVPVLFMIDEILQSHEPNKSYRT